MLARREAELSLNPNIRFMNIALAEEFTTRSVEAVRGHRRTATYKALVESYREEILRRDDSIQEADVSVEEEHDPFSEYFTNLESPPDDEDHFESHLLYNICKDTSASSREEIRTRLGLYLRRIFTKSVQQRPPRRHRARVVRNETRRQARRREYADTQLMWTRNRKRCINSILSGTVCSIEPDQRIMEPYWRTIFTQDSHAQPVLRDIGRQEDLSQLWRPVSVIEVQRSKLPLSTAAGPDGFTARLLRSMRFEVQVMLYNLILWCGRLPECLSSSRTIFIPKKNDAGDPGDFRPITIASVIVRSLHRILAARMSSAINIDERQRGFRSVYGCLDNIFQLDLILRQHRSTFQQMYMASVDVSKAFDSVSHQAIVAVLESFGVPQDLVR